MTEKLPRITAADAVRVLEKEGFSLARQSGKHKIYKKKGGRRIIISHHSSKILHPKILKSILQDANISVDRFKELL